MVEAGLTVFEGPCRTVHHITEAEGKSGFESDELSVDVDSARVRLVVETSPSDWQYLISSRQEESGGGIH